MYLDLGCGTCKAEGYKGMDARALPDVDYVWNVEDIPWWAIADGSVQKLRASHLIEHLNPHKNGFLCFMDEAWRVVDADGLFEIFVPHGFSEAYLRDPTHCNACCEQTFEYFDPEYMRYDIYRPRPWRILERHLDKLGIIHVMLRRRPLVKTSPR